MAASHDETSFQYNVTIRLQHPKQEEITDLEDIMLDHIKFYVREMKEIPQKIIFYRCVILFDMKQIENKFLFFLNV